ncbi:CHAT domain-containing protein [Pannus brasiliensis CCIBt3594]|uniref:CHAT domain-containing protein n=1 Tax=Pannus brasiliensis CCIBt3594 TaxID=1427578 RepID=A0AAW9QVH8_9CHRO
MNDDGIPGFSIAIARLESVEVDRFARWVTRAPVPGGYVHHDCPWTAELTALWMAWQEMFCLQESVPPPVANSSVEVPIAFPIEAGSYGGQLMQNLGIGLWRWLFQASIAESLARSQGIAMGKDRPLRARLEIRDPALLLLPWEIMQAEAGRQAIGLSPRTLFSRTTSDVDPLFPLKLTDSLDILLVLGDNKPSDRLQLEIEAARLVQGIIEEGENLSDSPVPVRVDPLIRPTAAELTRALDTGNYNAFFYAGHGMAAPNGGTLFPRSDERLNGTELAGALVRNRVTLAVFNACWGAYPARSNGKTLDRSSLAEVLIHHGVPSVVAMRDAIADREALSFIETFTRGLARRLPIDHALRFARQQLLTLYKYNQPAWTLPILYMHPDFDGCLLQSADEGITRLPDSGATLPPAYLRSLEGPDRVWRVRGGLLRVGRLADNDVILPDQWVSKRHGEIICRKVEERGKYQYYLRDFSRLGTFISHDGNWQTVHHQETRLRSGLQIRFGNSRGQTLEFVIE